MAEENTLYENNDVKITNLRAVFGSKTYAVNSITSVDTKTESSPGCAPAALLIFGLFMALFGYTGDSSILMIAGILVAVVGGVVVFGTKPTYIVRIASASGEVKAYTSQNKADIDSMVAALNNAIIQKG